MAERKEPTFSFPVIEERAEIAKTTIPTATVRVSTKVRHDRQRLDETLRIEEVEVDRIPMDRWVDGPLPTRQEGDTTIIPVIEEVAVVEKRYRLVEEVRVTRRQRTEPFQQEVEVRRTEISVERNQASNP